MTQRVAKSVVQPVDTDGRYCLLSSSNDRSSAQWIDDPHIYLGPCNVGGLLRDFERIMLKL